MLLQDEEKRVHQTLVEHEKTISQRHGTINERMYLLKK